jgi:CelD/BcsL family acetyltransferase involved in cellulose biosynthesis
MTERARRDAVLDVRVSWQFEEFLALEAEWDELWQSAEAATPMNSHALFRSWWASYGAGRRSVLATAREHGRLVAAAMFLRRDRGRWPFRVRILRAFGPPHTGARNAILHLDGRTDAAVALVRAVRRQPGWDALVVGRLETRWAQYAALSRELPWVAVRPVRDVALIRIAGSYEDYLALRSAKARYRLRKIAADLERAPDCRIEVFRGKQVDDGIFRRMVAIEGDSWKAGSAAGIAGPEHVPFFRSFIAQASERGWSRTYLLRQGDRDVAFNYLLDTGRRATGWRMSYREEFRHLSPGIALLEHAVRDSFRDGLAEIDLFDPPKAGWHLQFANDRLRLAEIVSHNPLGPGAALWLAGRLGRTRPQAESA